MVDITVPKTSSLVRGMTVFVTTMPSLILCYCLIMRMRTVTRLNKSA